MDHVTWYNREVALFSAENSKGPWRSFNIDREMDPYFKEAWCKRLHPATLGVLIAVQSFHESLLMCNSSIQAALENSASDLDPCEDIILRRRRCNSARSDTDEQWDRTIVLVIAVDWCRTLVLFTGVVQ